MTFVEIKEDVIINTDEIVRITLWENGNDDRLMTVGYSDGSYDDVLYTPALLVMLTEDKGLKVYASWMGPVRE